MTQHLQLVLRLSIITFEFRHFFESSVHILKLTGDFGLSFEVFASDLYRVFA